MYYLCKFSYVSKPGNLAPLCCMDIVGIKKMLLFNDKFILAL